MYIHYINLNSVHDSSFVIEKKHGIPDFLLLIFKRPSIVLLDNSVHTIAIPSALLIERNTPFKYFPTGEEYVDDYLHFTPDDPVLFQEELIFPLNFPIQISNDSAITNILQTVFQEYSNPTKYYAQTTELLIRLLMYRIGEQWELDKHKDFSSPHYSDLLTVRNLIHKYPEKSWTIEELAGKAHLSNAYFQVLYKSTFGITCISDLIQSKINKAGILLSSTNLSIDQIARELGYSDVSHFIRQYKKNTGITPGAFRKKTRDNRNEIFD